MLVQYWNIIYRRKWAVLTIFVGALAIGLLTTLLTTPVYTATARIEISREQQNVTKVEGLESPQAGQDDEFYQTQYSLLSARSLAERVAKQLRLATNDGFFDAHGVDPDRGIFFDSDRRQTLSQAERAKREALAVDLLLDHVTISPITRSRLVDVRYTSASPGLSAEIANTWTQQFIEATIDRRFASTANARKFLEERLATLGGRLEASERAVVRYATEKGIVSLGRQQGPDGRIGAEQTLVAADLQTLNAELGKATAERIEAASRLGGAAGAADGGISNPALAGLRQKRAEAAAEYAKSLVQYEPEYPTAQALAEQIRTLDASIAREEARLPAGRARAYSDAARREATLRQEVEQLKVQLNQQQRDAIQYNIFQREADTNRELFDSLLQRYKEIGVAGVALSNISVVDTARIPDVPSSPKLMINLALALVGGLALAFVVVLALEQIDEGLKDPSSATTLLHVPFLGAVPQFEYESASEVLSDVKSEMVEAYLSVQSNLAFSTEHGFPRSLLVTSSRPAEGKTTSSLALASVLGRTGKKVLLIDADMRSPSVHHFFGHSNDRGLSNYLVGDEDWKGMVLPTKHSGLEIMTAGPTPPSAAELLSGERIVSFVKHLQEVYDHVIIDSAPVMGLADAPLLSRAVEGCVFVVEAGGVPVRGLRSVLARLHQVQARVYGVIVTKVSQRQVSYGYGYGYGYGNRDEEA